VLADTPGGDPEVILIATGSEIGPVLPHFGCGAVTTIEKRSSALFRIIGVERQLSNERRRDAEQE